MSVVKIEIDNKAKDSLIAFLKTIPEGLAKYTVYDGNEDSTDEFLQEILFDSEGKLNSTFKREELYLDNGR